MKLYKAYLAKNNEFNLSNCNPFEVKLKQKSERVISPKPKLIL